MRCAAVVVAVGLLVMVSLPAAAGDQGKHKGKGSEKAKGHSAPVTVTFSTDERRAVEDYFVSAHGRGACPPGLAKKHNGCLPPGLAKKRYIVGQPLPKGVETHPPAPEIHARIGEPPSGYLYVTVDGDLLKLAVGTMMVVDAIDGLVH
jgi:hypothetical protein